MNNGAVHIGTNYSIASTGTIYYIYYIIGLLSELNSDVEFLLVPRDNISPQIIRPTDWVITQFLRCPGKISAGEGFTFRSPGAVNGTSRNFLIELLFVIVPVGTFNKDKGEGTIRGLLQVL